MATPVEDVEEQWWADDAVEKPEAGDEDAWWKAQEEQSPKKTNQVKACKGGSKGKGKGEKNSGKGKGGGKQPLTLTQRITMLNREGLWPKGRGINAAALSALSELPDHSANQILENLESKKTEISNPSGFLLAGTRRMSDYQPAEDQVDLPPWKRARAEKEDKPQEMTRQTVLTKVRQMGERGCILSPEAKSALFRIEPKAAYAKLQYLDDRAELPDPSSFLLAAIAREDAKDDEDEEDGEGNEEWDEGQEEEQTEKQPPPLCDVALFKLRFGEALRVEEAAAAKGKKGKKGKGKGKKGKDSKGKDGKGKGKDGKGKDGKGK